MHIYFTELYQALIYKNTNQINQHFNNQALQKVLKGEALPYRNDLRELYKEHPSSMNTPQITDLFTLLLLTAENGHQSFFYVIMQNQRLNNFLAGNHFATSNPNFYSDSAIVTHISNEQQNSLATAMSNFSSKTCESFADMFPCLSATVALRLEAPSPLDNYNQV